MLLQFGLSLGSSWSEFPNPPGPSPRRQWVRPCKSGSETKTNVIRISWYGELIDWCSWEFRTREPLVQFTLIHFKTQDNHGGSNRNVVSVTRTSPLLTRHIVLATARTHLLYVNEDSPFPFDKLLQRIHFHIRNPVGGHCKVTANIDSSSALRGGATHVSQYRCAAAEARWPERSIKFHSTDRRTDKGALTLAHLAD